MSTSALSRANKETILRALREGGAQSRTGIARTTGLSTATSSRLVTSLLEDGLVAEAGSTTTTGGRPSRMVRFNDSAAVTLALDVTGDHTDVALVDLGAHVIDLDRHDAARGPEERIRQTVALAEAGLARAARLGHRCVSAGVSIPGPVAPDGSVDFAPALEWQRVPLGPMLERMLPVPVVVENDANLIALAEYRHGDAHGVGSLVAVAVFEGIGSGIVEGGRVWTGSRGASGQLGRMLLDTEALRHVYSGFGDLESRLGVIGIAERARASGLAGPRPDGTTEARGPVADRDLVAGILTRAQAGDEAASAFLDGVFDEFAMSLANVCALLDPECIVLAGLFGEWAGLVMPALERRLVGHVLHLPALRPATPGLAATLVGASDAAFDRFGSVGNLL